MMSGTTRLRVWAPRASRVEIELVDRGERIPMESHEPELFELPRERVAGRYQLLVDGLPTPDPWAPAVDSVLGPCAPVDHAAFTWHDAGFTPPRLEDGVIYELHVGTFSAEGTFDGVIRHLPALVELGVTHLELMPVAAFAGERGWGYDSAALFAPHPAYGGPLGLKRLVDAAHAVGLAVVLDVVYNHFGPEGCFLDRFGPFFDGDRKTAWGRAINFDGPDSDEVRRFFLDNAVSWLRHYHLDGLRLDAIHAIHDRSPTHLVEELAQVVRKLEEEVGKRLILIAECERNDPRVVWTLAEHGLGCDAMWNDDFHHALHCALTGEARGYYADFAPAPLDALRRALTRGFVYDGRRSLFRRRRQGRPFVRAPLTRLIGFAQNHDQVGNRALGERLNHLVSPARAQIATTIVLTAPFVPMLFAGEEWGASTPFLYFTDHADQGIAEATRAGRRREHAHLHGEIPDPQARATFEKSCLRWAERGKAPHAEMLDYTRRLVQLRRSEPDLRDGRADRVRAIADDAQQTLLVERGRFFVACNLGPEPADVILGAPAELQLASGKRVRVDGEIVELGPDCAAVLSRRPA
jgi:maltooligosyltrehalose trehalohydrolase